MWYSPFRLDSKQLQHKGRTWSVIGALGCAKLQSTQHFVLLPALCMRRNDARVCYSPKYDSQLTKYRVAKGSRSLVGEFLCALNQLILSMHVNNFKLNTYSVYEESAFASAVLSKIRGTDSQHWPSSRETRCQNMAYVGLLRPVVSAPLFCPSVYCTRVRERRVPHEARPEAGKDRLLGLTVNTFHRRGPLLGCLACDGQAASSSSDVCILNYLAFDR